METETDFEEFKILQAYLAFAWDEELERAYEWVQARLDPRTWQLHNYWLGLPFTDIGVPELDEIRALVKTRNIAADLEIIQGEDEYRRERLYEELRGLI